MWFDSNRLCAVMPALILFSEVFQPMWRMKRADIRESGGRTVVCVNAEHNGSAIVRSGKGWGRKGNEKYYWVDFSKRAVQRLVKRPTKKIGGGWIMCVDIPKGDRVCFDWREDGSLGVASTRVRW